MNNIVEVAQNAKKIMSGAPVTCPCGEKWFSPFDKLYVSAYGKCTKCSDADEIVELGTNIFNIVNSV